MTLCQWLRLKKQLAQEYPCVQKLFYDECENAFTLPTIS